jgi:predicted transcriptional regulator
MKRKKDETISAIDLRILTYMHKKPWALTRYNIAKNTSIAYDTVENHCVKLAKRKLIRKNKDARTAKMNRYSYNFTKTKDIKKLIKKELKRREYRNSGQQTKKHGG